MRTAKRLIDILLSGTALIAVAPLLAVVALAVRACSPGPALFRQQRIGLRGKPFEVLKFRTMHVANAFRLHATTTTAADPRVFPLGNFLRRLKIDELPQLLNVLRGEMSLVGPRPTVAEDYRQMTNDQRRRAEAVPGMTGLAQIRGNTSLCWPERIEWDLQYVDQWSLWLDLKILAETIWMVATLKAETHPAQADEWQREVSIAVSGNDQKEAA